MVDFVDFYSEYVAAHNLKVMGSNPIPATKSCENPGPYVWPGFLLFRAELAVSGPKLKLSPAAITFAA